MNKLMKNKFYDYMGVWITKNYSKTFLGFHYEKNSYWQGIPDYRLLNLELTMLDSNDEDYEE